MNTSIVIPLSRADRWNHIELKYTLRGIEKHLSGYGDIFIIGAYPDWMKGGVHIPATDNEMVYDKQRNIFRKIMVACGDERVTERFLFMNDEHYLLKNYTAADFPYYYEGELHSQPAISDYKYTLQNTQYAAPFDWLYYDVHCPIVYNKEYLRYLDCFYDWSVKWGYCIKTLYCNTFIIKNGEPATDLKIRDPFRYEEMKRYISGRDWFSIGDKARGPELMRLLKELYPNKSIYEK